MNIRELSQKSCVNLTTRRSALVLDLAERVRGKYSVPCDAAEDDTLHKAISAIPPLERKVVMTNHNHEAIVVHGKQH
jgi:hypothetical protein